ncbi:MAG: formylglycine-generating enzyme family protein [Bradymonadia bacterium]
MSLASDGGLLDMAPGESDAGQQPPSDALVEPADAELEDAALPDAMLPDAEPIDPAALIAWVVLPGDGFTMGNTEAEVPNERPLRFINVEPFEMSRTEVTVEQYAACVEANACDPPIADGELFNWGTEGREQHPINGVTWSQAVDFAEWVGGRLPSEVEWEYVAKGQGIPFDPLYPWGIAEPTCELAHIGTSFLTEDGIFVEQPGCNTGITAPVCSLPDGNTLQGVCDMAGNVEEWIADYWHDSYMDAPADQSARSQPSPDHLEGRAIRGGHLLSQLGELQTHRRGFGLQRLPSWLTGFRVARDLE